MYTALSKPFVSVLLLAGAVAMSAGWFSRAPLKAQEGDGSKSADREKDSRKADARLDEILREWQKANDSIGDRHFSFKRTEDHVIFGNKRIVSGEILVHKPHLVRLDEKDTDGKLTYIVLCNGKSIHEYDFGTKTERVRELPDSYGFPEKPEQYPGPFLDRMYGSFLERIAWICMKWPVREQKDRFAVTLVKEDKNWIYIALKPVKHGGWFDFEDARIVLDVSTYRVRQIWLGHANGDSVTLDFDDADIDRKAVTFDSISKGLPKDWERVTLPGGKPEKDADKPK